MNNYFHKPPSFFDSEVNLRRKTQEKELEYWKDKACELSHQLRNMFDKFEKGEEFTAVTEDGQRIITATKPGDRDNNEE